jgi:hypothetical protein
MCLPSICRYGASYVDRASLLKEADEALCRAKRMQRGTGAIAGNSTLIQSVIEAAGTRTA